MSLSRRSKMAVQGGCRTPSSTAALHWAALRLCLRPPLCAPAQAAAGGGPCWQAASAHRSCMRFAGSQHIPFQELVCGLNMLA